MNSCFSGEKAPNRDSRHQDDCTVTTGREFGDTLFRNCIPEHQIPVFQFTVVCQVSPSSLSRFLINSCFSSENSPRNFSCFVPPYQFCRYRKFEFLPVFRCCIGIEFIRASRNSRLYLSVSFHMWLFSLLNACLETVTIKAYFSSSNSPSHS